MLKFPRRVYFTEKKPESGGCVGRRKTWPAVSKNSSQWASSAALREVHCSVLELLFVPCKVHLGHQNSGFGSAFFFFLSGLVLDYRMKTSLKESNNSLPSGHAFPKAALLKHIGCL